MPRHWFRKSFLLFLSAGALIFARIAFAGPSKPKRQAAQQSVREWNSEVRLNDFTFGVKFRYAGKAFTLEAAEEREIENHLRLIIKNPAGYNDAITRIGEILLKRLSLETGGEMPPYRLQFRHVIGSGSLGED